MYRKLFYLLAASIIVVVGAIFYREHVVSVFKTSETGQMLLRPFDMAATSVVTVEKDGKAATFLKDKTDRWTLLEESAYVPEKTIEQFLTTLTTLKKDVPATRLSAFYAEENVDEASACLVSVMDGDGTAQAVLFVGKPFETFQSKGFFVRLKDDDRSWRTFSDTDLCLKMPE